VTHFIDSYGLGILFLLVALESCGVPVPGETALLTAAVLAARGHFAIEWVIVLAATGAIVGDNVGYWLGREGGRRVLERWGPLRRFAERALPPAERFFKRHGGKTVFLARFVTGIRVTAAWMAGISRMHWWEFVLWNAAGGIAWAVSYGLLAYYAGDAAINAIEHYGLIGVGVVVVLVLLFFGGLHLWRRRLMREAA
jgi:membrane protein DedA with SNARE-associated domain